MLLIMKKLVVLQELVLKVQVLLTYGVVFIVMQHKTNYLVA